MTNHDDARERRKQDRLERLGSNEPRCGMCGETDDRTLELHHVAGRKQDDETVILCRNCHRKVTDDQKDHPTSNKDAEPALTSIGHFLLGLGDMLQPVADKLNESGLELIQSSQKKVGDDK